MRSLSHVIGPTESKRFAIFSVALCLALAGGGVGLVAARDHRDKVADSTLSKEASLNAAAPFADDDFDTESEPQYAAQPAPSPASAPILATPNQSVQPAAVGAASSARLGTSGAPSAGAIGGVPGNAQANLNVAPQPGSAIAVATAQPAQTTVEYVVVPVGVPAGTPAPTAAVPPAQPPAASSPTPPAPPVYNFSQQSAICGSSTCNLGEVCCNASCGTCAAAGATCDQTRCDNAITYPTSQACGMTTCNVGSVCCNPSCGLCSPQGEQCSQTTC